MTPQEMYPSQLNHIRGGLFGSVQGRRCTRSLLPAALYSLVVLLALTARVSAQSALADDAHTNSAPRSVDANFGAKPNLTVSSTGNIYIKFKLSSTLPAGTPGSAVEKATLKLYLGNVTAAGKLDVYAVGGSGNSFFGQNVGQANTTGFNNSFFGINTGRNNLTGAGNAFFGQKARLEGWQRPRRLARSGRRPEVARRRDLPPARDW